MVSTIKDVGCKKCGRRPSHMGKEPMYLVPIRGYKHIVLCGKHFEKFLALMEVHKITDYMNLFTHKDDGVYYELLDKFVKTKY